MPSDATVEIECRAQLPQVVLVSHMRQALSCEDLKGYVNSTTKTSETKHKGPFVHEDSSVSR